MFSSASSVISASFMLCPLYNTNFFNYWVRELTPQHELQNSQVHYIITYNTMEYMKYMIEKNKNTTDQADLHEMRKNHGSFHVTLAGASLFYR